MERIKNLMLKMMREELMRDAQCGDLFEELDVELIKNICSLAKSHDLAHIIASFLERTKLMPEGELGEKIKNQKMLAVYRYLQISKEISALTATLEEAAIPFILLKGSVIRKYYPEPWMRTSSDIDILVHEEDVERARLTVEDKLQYTFDSRNSHEVGMYSPSGVHFELHRTLIEEDEFMAFESVLSRVWENTLKADGCEYQYVLSDAMFYYYHIAHMAKHYAHGGCGIRPFIDLYFLRTDDEAIASERRKMLENGGLAKFAENAERLASVWFSDAEHTLLSSDTENYIIGSGVYGTRENYVAIQQAKRGNKLKYLLGRIWLPYDRLRHYYPSLNGKKILLPFYEFRRWMRLIFSKSVRRSSLNEIKTAKGITEEKSAAISKHLKNLGL